MSGELPSAGWHLARVSFEALSPLSCGAGEGDLADNAIARDANGLPYVPGPTLQGLLRAAYSGPDADWLFGPGWGAGAHSAAALGLSHAHVHDSLDAVAGFPADMSDVLLEKLAEDAPLTRHHVRLDYRHAAAPAGKFDRAAVPAGTRFSFELLLFAAVEDGTMIDTVLAAMMRPDFRIGGGSVRGYGKIRVTGARRGFFPIDRSETFRTVRQSSLSDKSCLHHEIALAEISSSTTICFTLEPVNPWRTGNKGVPTTTDRRRQLDPQASQVDRAPLREEQIVWRNGRGQWQEPQANDRFGYVLPGSTLRGPLAHRTLYHWNRQNGGLLTDGATAEDLNRNLANRAHIEDLFGAARGDGGQASLLIFDDVEVRVSRAVDVNHVKIDRFTGGAFAEALFSEELIESERLACSIHVRSAREGQTMCDKTRSALLAALRDLIRGRLAIGARSYGFCSGGEPTFVGEDASSWASAWEALAGTKEADHVGQS